MTHQKCAIAWGTIGCILIIGAIVMSGVQLANYLEKPDLEYVPNCTISQLQNISIECAGFLSAKFITGKIGDKYELCSFDYHDCTFSTCTLLGFIPENSSECWIDKQLKRAYLTPYYKNQIEKHRSELIMFLPLLISFFATMCMLESYHYCRLNSLQKHNRRDEEIFGHQPLIIA